MRTVSFVCLTPIKSFQLFIKTCLPSLITQMGLQMKQTENLIKSNSKQGHSQREANSECSGSDEETERIKSRFSTAGLNISQCLFVLLRLPLPLDTY